MSTGYEVSKDSWLIANGLRVCYTATYFRISGIYRVEVPGIGFVDLDIERREAMAVPAFAPQLAGVKPDFEELNGMLNGSVALWVISNLLPVVGPATDMDGIRHLRCTQCSREQKEEGVCRHCRELAMSRNQRLSKGVKR